MNAQEQTGCKHHRPTGRGDSGLELANSISLDRAAISLSRLLDRVNMANVAMLMRFPALAPGQLESRFLYATARGLVPCHNQPFPNGLLR